MVTSDIDNLIPHNVAGDEPIVQKTVPEMGGIISTPGGLDTHIPEDLLVISHNLNQNRRIPISASLGCRNLPVMMKTMKLDRARINRTTNVGK